MRSIPDSGARLQALWELRQYCQWVCYIFVSRGPKITKPPINPKIDEMRPLKERLADATNPATWASSEEAVAAWVASKTYKGVGFVFTATDPFCGIDLDHCIDPATGKIAPWARHILKWLNSYSEVSVSGTGIHIYVKASLTATLQALGTTHPKDIKHKKGGVEIYDQERYFTWSNKHIKGTPETIEERQDQINELYFELFFIEEETPLPPPKQNEPILQATLPDDAALIRLAENARNGHLFSQLWRGNISDYYQADSQETDHSRADLALCSLLAYWTQKEAIRIDRLFRQSALYRREKWDRPARSGETYGEGTIRIAIATCPKVYDPSWRPVGWVEYDQYRENLRKTTTDERGARA